MAQRARQQERARLMRGYVTSNGTKPPPMFGLPGLPGTPQYRAEAVDRVTMSRTAVQVAVLVERYSDEGMVEHYYQLPDAMETLRRRADAIASVASVPAAPVTPEPTVVDGVAYPDRFERLSVLRKFLALCGHRLQAYAEALATHGASEKGIAAHRFLVDELDRIRDHMDQLKADNEAPPPLT